MLEGQSTIEQQISNLEQQIREKRAILKSEVGGEAEGQVFEGPSEKEIIHSIVGEQIQQKMPNHPVRSSSQSSGTSALYQDPDLQPLVQDLVNIAFNKGIPEAVKEASRSKNPALIDAFHDVLVDELYSALIERKKLEEVK